ncbi:MAG: M48 family metallopeptidase [Candidatus Dormibacteraeota bacterium]|nr:M48 family metallopeptidase [Candidatus Dormibacteraeota bacterium]
MASPTPAGGPSPQLRIIPSARRRRSSSARLIDNVVEVRVPALMPAAEQRRVAERLRDRIVRSIQRVHRAPDLERRGQELNRSLFGGRLRWQAIGFAEQRSRWGSCTPGSGTIRIARRAAGLPSWVLDYLLVHELAHLVEGNHGPRFWELVERYPLTERARGYLMAVDHGAGIRRGDEDELGEAPQDEPDEPDEAIAARD